MVEVPACYCGGGKYVSVWTFPSGKGLGKGREVRTIAVQAQGDEGEDELKGAKREVEVNHHGGFRVGVYRGSCRVWELECGVWNA